MFRFLETVEPVVDKDVDTQTSSNEEKLEGDTNQSKKEEEEENDESDPLFYEVVN